MKFLSDLLDHDGFIMAHKMLINYFGLDCGLYLQDLISKHKYFNDRNMLDHDGWFYNTQDNIKLDTGLSEHRQRKALKKAIKLKIIESELRGAPPTNYFKIDFDNLYNTLEEIKDMENSVMNYVKENPSTLNNLNIENLIFKDLNFNIQRLNSLDLNIENLIFLYINKIKQIKLKNNNKNIVISKTKTSSRKKQTKSSKKNKIPISFKETLTDYLPKFNDSKEFKKVWIQFFRFRESIKKPLTKSSLTLLANKLNKYDLDTNIKAIELALIYEWRSIFPENNTNGSSQKQPQYKKANPQTKPEQWVWEEIKKYTDENNIFNNGHQEQDRFYFKVLNLKEWINNVDVPPFETSSYTEIYTEFLKWFRLPKQKRWITQELTPEMIDPKNGVFKSFLKEYNRKVSNYDWFSGKNFNTEY